MTCYIYAVGLHSQGGLNILNRFLEYKNEDADFHRLEERLGEGDSEDFLSMQTRFNPDLFLPSSWGVQLPVNLNFSKTFLCV